MRSCGGSSKARFTRREAGRGESVNPQARNYINRASDPLFMRERQAAGDNEEPLSYKAGNAE